MIQLRILLIIIISVMSAGCGFRLRGSIDIPAWFNNVAIVNQGVHRDLVTTLKDQIQAYHIHVLPDVQGATYLLILLRDSSQQQISSISASTTPRQYQLLYTVYYKVIKASGEPIVPEGQVTVTRQLTVNNDRILGSDSEESTTYSEMRRDAAMQIMNRVSRRLNAPPPIVLKQKAPERKVSQ